MRIKPENLPLIHRYAAHGRIGINSHDALDDAYACAGVFFKLIESLKKGSVNDGSSH